MKMRATAKMPRGVLNRYRTRMLVSEGNTFEERSPKWTNFYVHQGWAVPIANEPAPPRRSQTVKASQPADEPGEPEPTPKADEYDLEMLTNDELRTMAEQRGHELPNGYVKNADLVELLRGA